jgi:hypothetical protein
MRRSTRKKKPVVVFDPAATSQQHDTATVTAPQSPSTAAAKGKRAKAATGSGTPAAAPAAVKPGAPRRQAGSPREGSILTPAPDARRLLDTEDGERRVIHRCV